MKSKYILTVLAVALFCAPAFAVAPTADSEDVNKDQAGYIKSDGQTYAVRITSSGHTIPGTDKGADLGSPTKRWRNLYASSISVNGGSLNVSTDSLLNLGSPAVYVASGGITIPLNSSYMTITSSEGVIIMSAKPAISTATAHDGDQFTIVSTTASIVFTDRLTTVNTGLALGAATRTLGYLDNISFVFNASSSVWVERSFTNVQ